MLILTLPILLLLPLILTFHFRRSPFFVHQRAGKDGQVFHLFKFRTMKVDFKEDSLTQLGKWVRSFSLDEIPQFINILKGDMSIIGPRPLLIEYLDHYTSEEKRRHDVLPGITGWAQVNGRNEIDWGKRMAYDIYYVQHASMLLDLNIIWRTFLAVLQRDMTSYRNEKTITFTEYASKR